MNTFRLHDRINLYFIRMASALLYHHRSTLLSPLSLSLYLFIFRSPSLPRILCVACNNCSRSITKKELRNACNAEWDRASWYIEINFTFTAQKLCWPKNGIGSTFNVVGKELWKKNAMTQITTNNNKFVERISKVVYLLSTRYDIIEQMWVSVVLFLLAQCLLLHQRLKCNNGERTRPRTSQCHWTKYPLLLLPYCYNR